MSSFLSVRNLRKSFSTGLFKKRTDAVLDISFDVEPGEIFAFLGPNGAGKTTTIKAILGLIRPDEGSISVFGNTGRDASWRKRIGYMPEHPTFYEYLTAVELVAFFGRLAGLSQHEADTQAKRNLGRVGLERHLDVRLRKFSKGMLQRAGLAQALMGTPDLLILDEPMTGLDPIGRRDMRTLITSLREEGRTVFYSTHILPDVEMTCDRVSIIHRGRTRTTGDLAEILGETTRGVSVTMMASPEQIAMIQARHAVTVRSSEVEIEFPDEASAQRFVSEMLGVGASLVRFESHRDDLETIFMRTLEEDVAA